MVLQITANYIQLLNQQGPQMRALLIYVSESISFTPAAYAGTATHPESTVNRSAA